MTVNGSSRATRNMRSRMKRPVVGCPACGKSVLRTMTRGLGSGIGPFRLARESVVGLAIAADTGRPAALGFHEKTRTRAQLCPAGPVDQKLENRGRQSVHVARAEQDARLLVANQLAMATDVRGGEQTSLGHGLERFERRDELRQTHRQA